MSTHEKDTFIQTYQWANGREDLPWAHNEPTLFLPEICRSYKPGKALDIGCGAGTDSVYLAQQGWDVTSLDFVPKALEFTQQRAEDAGVTITPVEADITQWQPPHSYDLVLDHGLLHNMDPVRYDDYRKVVMQAIGDSGEFVLLHWHPLFDGQQDGDVGPTRVSREDIKNFFAPELQERLFGSELFESLPSMVGGGMTQAYYWFKPNMTWHRSSELLQQIQDTLTKNDASVSADAEVPDELLSKLLGPGRLGVRHVDPQPDEIAGIIAELAEHAGTSGEDVGQLLQTFASAEHGNVCIANSRCDVCHVDFCKRRRYR